MAKRKSERFKILQKLAGKYEELAAQSLGKSVGNLDAQKARLSELEKFREEYTQQFQAAGAEGISGSAIQSYQNFISQLGVAIEQQRQTVFSAEIDKSQKKDVWQDKHRTTRIYDKTIEKFSTKEQKDKDRREQKEQDERAHTLKES